MLYNLMFTDIDRKYTLFFLGVIVLYLVNSWSDKLFLILKVHTNKSAPLSPIK
jgi:hypothetical protein